MPVHAKAKTSPTGYTAMIQDQRGTSEFPIARFDDDGYALICSPDTGRLVRAAEYPGFAAVLPMWQVAR